MYLLCFIGVANSIVFLILISFLGIGAPISEICTSEELEVIVELVKVSALSSS